MKMYLVRYKENDDAVYSKEIIGLFAATSIHNLFSLLDTRLNPYDTEYTSIIGGGAVWFDDVEPEFFDSDDQNYQSITDFTPGTTIDGDNTLRKYPMIERISMDENLEGYVQHAYHEHEPNERLYELPAAYASKWSTFPRKELS